MNKIQLDSLKEGLSNAIDIVNKHLDKAKTEMLAKSAETINKPNELISGEAVKYIKTQTAFRIAQEKVLILEDVIQEMWRKINGSGVCY